MARLLLLVDPQCDFINGSLPVPGAESAMQALAGWLADNAGSYAARLVTCDWHPWDHCSFGVRGGQWPRHCVRHSAGAAIWPQLMRPLHEAGGQVRILPKGSDRGREEYSIFQNEEARAEILELAAGIGGIDICGIAGDICVLNTLRDGVNLLGAEKFAVIERFAPSLDGGAALAEFCQRNSVCVR